MQSMNLPVSNELIDLGSLVVLVFIMAGIAYKARGGSFHHFFRWDVLSPVRRSTTALSGATGAFFVVLFREVFTSRVLRTCSQPKRLSHLAIFWGFVFLGVSTTLAFLTNPENAILPLDHPVKLFGNIGGVLVVAGFAGMFYIRYREHAPVWRLTRSDVFLLVLFLTVVTGFTAQQAIYSAAGPFWVSGTFWVHMVLVVALLATAPFTKFFHAITKPLSLLYDEIDRRAGVEPLLPSDAASSKEGSGS